jgi:hypothetical protein
MFTAFFNRSERGFEVALVIQGVKYPENINAYFSGVIDKGGNYIIGVMAVTHQVLPPEQHLKWGIGHQSF